MMRRAVSSGVSASAFMLATPALLISTSSVPGRCGQLLEQLIDRVGDASRRRTECVYARVRQGDRRAAAADDLVAGGEIVLGQAPGRCLGSRR